jgi:hypothetical protein
VDLRSLQVTAPLAPNEGVATVIRRLARVAGFYAAAAALGAVAVLLVALVARLWEYVSSGAPALQGYSPLILGLAIVWGIFTVGLIVLLIYGSTLTRHEDDELFLHDAEDHMANEHDQSNRVAFAVRAFGLASGALILVLALVLAYSRYTA